MTSSHPSPPLQATGSGVLPASDTSSTAGADENPRAGVRTLGALWAWGWLAVAHLVLDLLAAVPFLMIVVLVVLGAALTPLALAGAPLLALGMVLAMGVAAVERARVQALTGVRIVPVPGPDPTKAAWRRLLLDARPWRATAYLLVISVWGIVAGTATLILTSIVVALAALPTYQSHLPDDVIALPGGGMLDASNWPWLTGTGLAGLLLLPLLARGLVTLDVILARHLLGRSPTEEVRELSARVQTLTQTREATVDSVEAERRRIERDLHDGPQQRLVAIAMDLGMARTRLRAGDDGTVHADDCAKVRELIDRAHGSAKEAIVEMRQVARGIAPPVLTDRGLDAALSALAARAPVPVDVRIALPWRPSPTVEAIAYFCVSEALTNIAKHARATRARVDVSAHDAEVLVTVADNGVGGADPVRGTGLHGLRDRVRAVDGVLEVTSPPGTGTTIAVRLPERHPRPAVSVVPTTPSAPDAAHAAVHSTHAAHAAPPAHTAPSGTATTPDPRSLS